jgi:hypothetical protein
MVSTAFMHFLESDWDVAFLRDVVTETQSCFQDLTGIASLLGRLADDCHLDASQ